MELKNFDLQELSVSEQRNCNGGWQSIWYYFGRWAKARYDGIFEDLANGVYCD